MSAPIDLLALAHLPVWRWRAVASLLRAGEPPADILTTLCADDLRHRRGRPVRADPGDLRARAVVALERAVRSGLVPVSQLDARFPAALLEIVDPPPVLWLRGCVSAPGQTAVAIVGSRAGSSYALSVAERLGADLASAGLAVVSGLARGVDAAAHRGALSVGGVTVAVLGCGADVVYPPEHAQLAADVTRDGAVVSELPPGTVPKPGFFPRRNRLISGLVRAVVVVEAGEKSGSLITARCALEQGRDVLAVPGNVLSGRNRGGHALLRDGARLVESADDVLDELGLAAMGVPLVSAEGRSADLVLASLPAGEPADLAQIAALTGLTPVELLPRLLDLELRRLVRREPGGRFVRLNQSC